MALLSFSLVYKNIIYIKNLPIINATSFNQRLLDLEETRRGCIWTSLSSKKKNRSIDICTQESENDRTEIKIKR